MKILPPDKTILYTIENAIKTYRKFAQANIRKVDSSITIDQMLLITMIRDNPDMQLKELATKLFKDNASVTRILELLVRKGYIEKRPRPHDRRSYEFHITAAGAALIEQITPIIAQNRKTALNGISKEELRFLEDTLTKLIENCK